ncbi:hypothetical protein A4R44_04470 [Amycolatopsis sp. M39]|nr:hypothetical protein A4R44_04470 [Amycolatopsis sp. M39]
MSLAPSGGAVGSSEGTAHVCQSSFWFAYCAGIAVEFSGCLPAAASWPAKAGVNPASKVPANAGITTA